MKKNFSTFNENESDSVTENMINTQIQPHQKEFSKPEPKNRRVNILIRESLYERLKKRTDTEYISMNEQINQYIDEELKKRGY